MKDVYVTTAIPYVNGEPHLGHACDYLLADIYSRYQKSKGNTVRFQAGTDEHGSKIYNKAKELNLPTSEYVDQNSKKFQDFIKTLGVEYTDFVRTTDEHHVQSVQAIWKKLEPHIYSADYEGWYCEGCESFVTDKEYADNNGVCPDHKTKYQRLSETNYYLRISDFKDKIKGAIESDEIKILPDFRKKEVLKLLVDSPDVSISRPTAQLTWGVPVPGDDSQVMYVWLDALANYITVLGYPETDIKTAWPADVQIVGKDILRFHAIIWPAILLGLDLPLPKVILSHGFILANGAKMSKSIGNVVDPFEVLDRYNLDAFRYFFTRHIDTFADSDFTWEKYDAAYNNELANDLGNLVQRLATLCSKNNVVPLPDYEPPRDSEYLRLMDDFEFTKAIDHIWLKVQNLNRRIDETKPWSLVKEDQAAGADLLRSLAEDLLAIATLLAPFLPTTSARIRETFANETGEIAIPAEPLFPKGN